MTRAMSILMTAVALTLPLTLAARPAAALSAYRTVNLVSDIPGLGRVTDPALRDAWGFTFTPDGPFFIVNTNSGFALTYQVDGKTDRVRKVAPDLLIPALPPFTIGLPTDVVTNDTQDFIIGQGMTAGPARYIMSGLDGTLTAWKPGLPTAVRVADNSANALAYTGLALARNRSGNFLFAANCAQARIDVYDKSFQLVSGGGRFAFANPAVPAAGKLGLGYMPFNIQNIGGRLFVAYAIFNPATMEEVKLPGTGIVAVFNTDGRLIRNIAIGTDAGGPFGQLNAPWGFAIAPDDFGDAGNALLVGNFGDGAINVFDPESFAYRGQLRDMTGQPLKIDGLWAMSVGNGTQAGSEAKLYFTAGPNNEADGLFGFIRAIELGDQPGWDVGGAFPSRSRERRHGVRPTSAPSELHDRAVDSLVQPIHAKETVAVVPAGKAVVLRLAEHVAHGAEEASCIPE
jgi:uncharacterized protein (TIGR03118 family)